jgi:hypothetical protein
MSIGRSLFEVGFQLSPIILTNGIAANIPGGMLPIIAITQAANFTLGLLNGTSPIDQNQFFANFRPLPGSTLINNEIGDYPFANQATAANAIITKPLSLSMIMDCPANQPGAYTAKLATFSALKAALDTHNNLGGTYTVATPAYIYTNMILLQLRDVSRTDTKQVQNAYQFDFIKPLLTEEQATTALGSLMQKISGGLPTSSTVWSSLENATGGLTSGIQSVIGSASNLVGTAASYISSSLGQ